MKCRVRQPPLRSSMVRWINCDVANPRFDLDPHSATSRRRFGPVKQQNGELSANFFGRRFESREPPYWVDSDGESSLLATSQLMAQRCAFLMFELAPNATSSEGRFVQVCAASRRRMVHHFAAHWRWPSPRRMATPMHRPTQASPPCRSKNCSPPMTT